jgi:hypothetical protein
MGRAAGLRGGAVGLRCGAVGLRGGAVGLRHGAAHVAGVSPVTAVTAVVSVIMGLVVGGYITAIITSAAISHSQERMQRKVRYWQTETARARARADELAREVAAREGFPAGRDDWPKASPGSH